MLKILVVDDHAIVREGLKQILADNPDIVVSGEASNGGEALHRVSKNKYDLVLLDISMPDRSGLEVLRDLRSQNPKLPVMILTMHTEEQYALRAFKEGASGYITKESAPEELIDAILQVSSGGKYITHSLAKKLASHVINFTKEPSHTTLSLRELEVMSMIISGMTVKEIATELRLGQRTIRTYRHRIKCKIGVESDLELMRYALENNLFT